MSEKTFQTLYKKLNKEQKDAVDTIEGPVMVVAGPGTGKTTILTLRIAQILRKTDADPSSVLALTFTESGVHSMRKKLVQIIGSTAYNVRISTFHGFANEVINRNPDDFPRIVGSEHIAEVDQIKILEEIIDDQKLEFLKPYGDPFFYLKPVLNAIRNLKRENISLEDFENKITKQEKEFKSRDDLYHEKGRFKGKMKGKFQSLEKDIKKNKELLKLYRLYEKKLREDKLRDFEDMLLEVIRILEENEDLLLRLQEKYQYILADEHQDANFAQNRILELLSTPPFEDKPYFSPNLFIVGDEKQAIFRFQGASLDNFLYFKKKFPEAKLITLVDNYRSTQAILDSAHSLIENTGASEEVPRQRLLSKSGTEERNIHIYEFSTPEHERLFILKDIKEKLKSGVPAGEIAVLYRDNKDAFPIVDTLEKSEIPFVLESSTDALSDEEIVKLTTLFRAVSRPADSELLLQVLYFDFIGLDSIDAFRISAERYKQRTSAIQIVKDKKKLKAAGIEDIDKVQEFYKKFLAWSKIIRNKHATSAFEIIVSESGFLSHLMSLPGGSEKLSKLETIFGELKRTSAPHRDFKLPDFLSYIEMLDKYNLSITSREEALETEAVRLMTAHRSKGLEFDSVYILGVTDGHWGNRRTIKHFNIPIKGLEKLDEKNNDDERRLFYVALTRAKKDVALTYSQINPEGREVLRSQFIEEIEEKFKDTPDLTGIEKALDKEQNTFAPKKTKAPAAMEKKFLNNLFLEQGLSVTALNNYLECPWQYLFVNLLRIPKAPNKFQGYGIAVHEALYSYFEMWRREKDMRDSDLIRIFERSLERQILTESELEELREKGKKALSGYLKKYKKEFSRNIFNELDVAGVFLSLQTGQDILLKGKLDKIEIGDGGTYVHVVDYKTAQPKTRNYIEGKTKSSNGNYKRQLVFYKILLDRYEKNKFVMQTGEIDFIEPDDKGRYKKEIFEITPEEVAGLEEEIKRVSGEILGLKFWDKNCGDKKCEYCRLGSSLNRE